MKATIFYSLFTIVSLYSLSTFGQATCPNGSGTPNNNPTPYINDPAGPYDAPANDYLNPGATATGVSPLGRLTNNSNSNLATPASTVTPAVPAARITVLPADASLSARVTPKTPTATLTIVADEDVISSTPKEAAAPEPNLDERIAKLVGIWKAVARRGNGELTTVELHLDNRGWAELTVPGNDGKPSTTKSRVDFENDELKLKGDDQVVSLGKLVESNARQMVFERAEGRVTFVRL